jgi:PAS domain S-box-containing protein
MGTHKKTELSSDQQHLSGIIFDSISDGVFTVDKSCVITSFNRAAEQITGFSARAAVGRHCFDIFRTEVCHKQCALRDTLSTHAPVDKVRVTMVTEDGCEVPIQVSTTLLKDREGEVVGAVEFFRDLTELEQLRRRLDHRDVFDDIVSISAPMRRIIETLPDIAESECNVLIQGPSGSGKELVAEAIHNASPRRYGQAQLRGAAGYAARVGALRLRQGGVHRRQAGQAGALLHGQRRHAAAR